MHLLFFYAVSIIDRTFSLMSAVRISAVSEYGSTPRIFSVTVVGRNSLCFALSIPFIAATTMGHFAFCAILKAPFLNSPSSPVFDLVPSGNIPILTAPRAI